MSKVTCKIKEDLSADPESTREEPASELLQYLGNAAKLNESDFTSSALVQLIDYEAPTFPMGEKLVYK